MLEKAVTHGHVLCKSLYKMYNYTVALFVIVKNRKQLFSSIEE